MRSASKQYLPEEMVAAILALTWDAGLKGHMVDAVYLRGMLLACERGLQRV